MDSKLKGKTTIITGSSENIGKATAIKFAQEGSNLVLNCKSSVESLQKTVSEIKKIGVKVIGIQADVSKADDVGKLFKQALDNFDTVDILVNSVAPGFVLTPNYDKTPQNLKDEFIQGTLLKRWLNVDEIADAMIYLAKADGVTGEVLTVDAGWNLKL